MHNDKYIVFDFDGTLADTIDFALNAFNQVAGDFNLPVLTQEQRAEIKTNGFKEMLKTYKISKMLLPKIILKVRQQMSTSIAKMPLINGIDAALNELKAKGFKVGILTSNSEENVGKFLAAHQMTAIFDFVYSEKSLFGKKTVINHMLKQEQIAKENIVYVGDETRDVEACQKTGIPVIAVSWGLNSRQALAQSTPNRLADIVNDIFDQSYPNRERLIQEFYKKQ